MSDCFDNGSGSESEGWRSGLSSVGDFKKKTPDTPFSISGELSKSYTSPKPRNAELTATGLTNDGTGLTTTNSAKKHVRYSVTSNGMTRYGTEREGAENTPLESSYQGAQSALDSANSVRPPYSRTTRDTELHRRSFGNLDSNAVESGGGHSNKVDGSLDYESRWRDPSLPQNSGPSSAGEEMGRIEMSRSAMGKPGTFEDFLDGYMQEDITPLSADEHDKYRYPTTIPAGFRPDQRNEGPVADVLSGFTLGPGQTAVNVSGHSTPLQASTDYTPGWLQDLWDDRSDAGSSVSL